MATIVTKASGIVRAAAYMAKMADASVGLAPAGRTSSGFISPAMEKPLATTTFRAVRAEARPMLSADREVVAITDVPIGLDLERHKGISTDGGGGWRRPPHRPL